MKKTAFCSSFLALVLSASVSNVSACINEIGRGTVGEGIYVGEHTPDEFLKALSTHEDKTYWKYVLKELRALTGPRSLVADRENRNNMAVAMLHLGSIKEAIEILKKIEKEQPGLYYTATNLGTAYELNGENAKALEWIKEGINRNKDAHNGSEWLHVKILEAKLALEKDPSWLTRNSVIGLHGISSEQLLMTGHVTTGNLNEPIDLRQVEAALIYQLHERLEFIKPPEGVVANLLFDLSRTLERTRGPDHASAIRNFAQTYGPDLMPWVLMAPIPPAIELPPNESVSAFWIAAASALPIALAIGVFLFRRRRT